MAKEDEDAVATDYCKNCKRDIPSVNYIMHQTHCSRNIVLCNQCKEPVPRSEMEEHNDEYHAKVTCKCGEAVEKCKQEEHDAEHCPQRQVQCEYCEMDMDHKSLTEHKDFCGSRTDPCPLCNRYIFFRDKARHEESSCQYPAKPKSVGTSSLSSLNQRQTNPFQFGSLDSAEGLRQQQELFDQFPGAPRTRNSGPLAAGRGGNAREMRRVFSEETADDRKHRKNLDRIQNMMAKSGTRSREKNEERALLQSMVNQEDSDECLAHHLAHDLYPDASSFPTDQFQSAGRDFPDNIDIHGIMKEGYGIPAINTFRDQHSDLTLPCEFCQQQIPAETLIVHQTGCRPDISCHPVPDSSLANNSRQRSHQQSHPPQPPSDVLNNLGFGAFPSGYLGSSFGQPDNSQGYVDDNLTMIPCEFCDVRLPADAIPMHQVNCFENRTETPLPATFDTAPGSYPTQRGVAVKNPIRPILQKVQRPQDFAVPNRPSKYPEQQPVIDFSDPEDEDEDEDVDIIPVKMDKSRHPPQSQSQYPRKTFSMAPAFQQRKHPLGQSASEKYLQRSSRGGHARPTATVTGHPIGGAIPKPKANNTAGQSRYFEDRPHSKSKAGVQETLQALCDTPVLLEEEELNNVVGGRLNSRLGVEQDSYPLGNNRTKSSNKAIPLSFGPSSVDTDSQTAAPFQTRPSPCFNNLPRPHYPGARQKMSRKPHTNNSRSGGHADGYAPSFARGENQPKGRERIGNSGASRRAKQQSAATTMTFDPNGLNQSTTLQVKGESPASRTANQQISQKRKPAAPRQNARRRDDAMP